MRALFNTLNDTFYKSTVIDFKAYLNQFAEPPVTKWTIYSDYCFDDSNKFYNAATFTVIPYVDDINTLKGYISSWAPKDLKETRDINEIFCEFVKSGYSFNFGFVFNQGNSLLSHVTKEEYLKGLDEMDRMLQTWIINTPQQEDYFKSIIKRVNILRQEMKRRTFNLTLWNNILLIQILASYITYVLSKENLVKPEIIGWFSDRDKMTTGYKEIIFDFYHINFHNLCNNYCIDDSKIELVIGKSVQNDNKLWYDEMIRMADYLSGTLAGSKKEGNKYNILFESGIADNPYLSVINLKNDLGNLSASRRLFTKKQ